MWTKFGQGGVEVVIKGSNMRHAMRKIEAACEASAIEKQPRQSNYEVPMEVKRGAKVAKRAPMKSDAVDAMRCRLRIDCFVFNEMRC